MEVVLDSTPAGYCKYAADYLEEKVDAEAVTALYDLRPATAFVLRALNPNVELNAAFTGLRAMGFPVA